MRKIFTFAAAVLMSMSIWADTMVNLPTDLEGNAFARGCSYMYHPGVGSVSLDNNCIYFCSYDSKIENKKINLYRTTFVFKPAISCNLAYNMANTKTSKRTYTSKIYAINEKLYKVYWGGDKHYLASWIKENASDEDLNGIWKDAGVTKISSGNIAFVKAL